MKMRYEIQGRILIVHQNGVSDPDEIARLMSAALDDPRLQPRCHLLWNALDAPAEASADKMQELLAGMRRIGDRFSGRWAMMVDTKLQYGVARMFAAYSEAERMQVEVFYDLDSAMAWLLLEEPTDA